MEGVCRVLSTYWEVIPAQTIATFLDKLVKDLARCVKVSGKATRIEEEVVVCVCLGSFQCKRMFC